MSTIQLIRLRFRHLELVEYSCLRAACLCERQRRRMQRRAGGASSQFTRTELAILDRLKLGKANKIIAHELGVSESTVKVHIGRMMKKLKVTNRTQIVCRTYALALRLLPLLPVTSTFCSLGA